MEADDSSPAPLVAARPSPPAQPPPTAAPDVLLSTPEEAESVDFTRHQLALDAGGTLSLAHLRLIRGIVFGRHGRIFKEQDIQRYLESRPWYHPNSHFSLASLNATERANLDVIREKEAGLHRYLEPGDMRIYGDQVVERSRLRRYSSTELRILQAEIEAIHGRRFPNEPWLQTYFNERYWYRPGNYSPASLSSAERSNLALLAGLAKEQRHLRLAPGQMGVFQNEPINEGLLRGLSLYELRLLRNEVYARHGQRFHTSWLADYFGGQDWYHPRPDFAEPALSAVENTNVQIILQHENRLHQELSTKPLKTSLLEDMQLEDVRKLRTEIYARHGRRFKDPSLRDYFTGLSWYRPNSGYRESWLSRIERHNVRVIRRYEEHLESIASHVEA
jgi:hypothetical protein